ncbi:MAG: RNA helicase [Gammaproteobacteria bacterium SG8_47]|nr:MAG: RNA helicase [Gammaproteobacteria bacterium SG8_47]
MSENQLKQLTFSDFNLPTVLLQALADMNFTQCTPIQAQTLPLALAGQDVAGQAQTGTGKTAAFLIALFNRLLSQPPASSRRANQPRAIVIAPTRELAVQIHKDAVAIGKYAGMKLGLVYGGTGYESQRQQLEEGDEADRMFDLGFIKDIRFMLRRMPGPTERLTMLFSATLSYRVTELAYEHMNNPIPIRIEPEQVTAERVRESVFYPAKEEKIPLLLGLLKAHGATRTMVFVNTKRVADRVQAYLVGNGYDCGVLSGDVPQKQRERLLQRFSTGDLPVLVATDVAARGLHIPDVSHVINYDLPQDCEDYVHRIGRTARAGASGDAISFACDEYAFSMMDIEEYIGHRIPVEQISEDLLVKPAPPAPREHRPRRPSGPRGGNTRAGTKKPRRRPRGSKPPQNA